MIDPLLSFFTVVGSRRMFFFYTFLKGSLIISLIFLALVSFFLQHILTKVRVTKSHNLFFSLLRSSAFATKQKQNMDLLQAYAMFLLIYKNNVEKSFDFCCSLKPNQPCTNIPHKSYGSYHVTVLGTP